jgi:organic hydroperoxide reductase OsmC/OhrA
VIHSKSPLRKTQRTAEELMLAAHQVCPYSNAVHGNIDVTLSVRED